MKKTLVALTVAAFATSASAFTAYDAEGTKVEVDGSLRLILEKGEQKTKVINGSTKKVTDSNLRNAGSRFGVRAQHQLGEDFYALGRLEFRFNKNTHNDQFGDVYAHRAYVGLGSKVAGEATFGRQVTIIDDMGQNADYEWGLSPKGNYAPTAGTQVVRYDYKGVEGLQVGAGYLFDETSKDDVKTAEKVKNAYNLGVIYARDAYDFRLGYGHTNYQTGTATKHRQDAYFGSASYAFGDFKAILDFGFGHEKEGSAKTNKFYVYPGFTYQVVPASKIYGSYLYERVKHDQNEKFVELQAAKAAGVDARGVPYPATAAVNLDAAKVKTHGFLLGADYKLHKNVVAFVEGKYVRAKAHAKNATGGYDYVAKTTDKAIGVGMRVFW